MSAKIKSCIIFVFICIFIMPMMSYAEVAAKTSPNYLIILLPGIGAKGTVFGHGDAWDHKGDSDGEELYGDLKYYLEHDLGLNGYVYCYSFADENSTNATHARELGDRIYYIKNPNAPNYRTANGKYQISTGKCMLEQAREDFKSRYASEHNICDLGSIPESVIPQKYIIIAHSMGGLATRSYLTSDYYQNDVVRAVFIDTPHLGADGAIWYNNFRKDRGLLKSLHGQLLDYATKLLVDYALKSFGNPPIEGLYVSSANMALAGMSNLLSDTAQNIISSPSRFSMGSGEMKFTFGLEETKGALENIVSYEEKNLTADYLKQSSLGIMFWLTFFAGLESPALDELCPGSAYLNELKTAMPHPNPQASAIDSIQYRVISPRGCPTPHKDMIATHSGLNPYSIGLMLPFLGDYNRLPSEGAKLYSALLTLGVPGFWALKDGSLLVAIDSSRGDGVRMFEQNTIRYEYLFQSQNMNNVALYGKGMNDMAMAAYLALQIIPGFQFNPAILAGMMFLPSYMLSRAMVAGIPEFYEVFSSHGQILRRAYKEGIIDRALEDIIVVGGQASRDNAVSAGGISAAAVGTSSGGFSPPSQAFVLLSDKNKDGTDAGLYHSVTIETVTESNNKTQAAPIEFDGQKKWVAGVMVKEPPTALKGVINTFLPKKLKSFEFSENFAAWKPVPPVDEWGNFTVKGLKFAEGQNVIAFRGESWVGNKLNQILTITVNTIPMLPSGFTPAPNSFLNNNRPKISCRFAKAAYSESPLESISVVSAKLTGPDNEVADVTDKLTIRLSGGDYDKRLDVEYVPVEGLEDGSYKMVIVAESNVGITQALWNFTIDTKPPTVRFMP